MLQKYQNLFDAGAIHCQSTDQNVNLAICGYANVKLAPQTESRFSTGRAVLLKNWY